MTVRFPVRLMAVPLLALVLGGCADEPAQPRVATADGTIQPSRGAEAPVDEAGLGRKFAACMRAEGIDMPDPSADGMAGLPAMKVGDEAGAKKMDAAMEKCREFLPDGGEPPKMSADDLAKAREFAKCARENGAPDFPDPDPETGRFAFDPDQGGDLDMSEVGDKCPQFGAGVLPGIEVAG